MVRYYLVASSRSRVTEVYQNRESGKLVEVYRFKSGRIQYTPVEAIDRNLTVRYNNSDEYIEGDANPQYYIAPVEH